MSLQITVEDGRRQRLAELGDTSGALDKLGALGTGLLAGVDPYGHTMFNRRQLSLVIAELETYSRSADLSAEQAGFVSKLVMLVRRYEEEPHVYLWFYGD